ncbi:MAG: phosphatidate cytidylyltransferase [Pseudomonadota bacterium]
MSPGGGAWDDLSARLISAGAMAAVGLGAMAAGGVWFAAVIATVSGLMIWELARMLGTPWATALGIACGAGVFITRSLTGIWDPSILAPPILLGVLLTPRGKPIFAVGATALVLAGWGLVEFRAEYGVLWLFWLVLVVVATDVAGYFAGKAIGGPKFWPTLSPKKTWAGVIAGWTAALGVGAVFLSFTTAGPALLWISVLLSFSSQMGDILESALKRHVGVKDTSQLIPGHGGLLDRFDGLLGAALFMMLVALLTDVPVVRV